MEETASVVYKDILDWIQQKLPWTVLGHVHTNPDKWIQKIEALELLGASFITKSGAPNENIVQNYLNIALFNVF